MDTSVLFEFLTLIYGILKAKMSLWTMEEDTRNKLAIILILHKGVLRESLCEMLMVCEQWEVPVIPEAPLKSQQSCYSVLVYSVQY